MHVHTVNVTKLDILKDVYAHTKLTYNKKLQVLLQQQLF